MRDLDVRRVTESLEDPLQRLGFIRRPAFLEAVDEDPSARMVASWRRDRTDRGHTDSREEQTRRDLDADWASIWDNGRVHLFVAGMAFFIEWRRTPLEGDAVALALEALVNALDRYLPV